MSDNKQNLDVLLVILPEYDVVAPPMGIAYLSSYLRSKGLKTKVFDFNIELYNQTSPLDDKLWWVYEGKHIWAGNEDTESLRKFIDVSVEKILATGVKVIGFSVFFTNFWFSCKVAMEIKKRCSDKVIIFGGPECNEEIEVLDKTEYQLIKFVDFIIIGEGEKTLFQLLLSLKKSEEVVDVPGVISLKNNNHSCVNRLPIANIDEIPAPSYIEFDLKSYTGNKLHLFSSRGCTNKCAFCTDCVVWKGYREHSPQHMIEEIVYHIERHKITCFVFSDSSFNLNVNRLNIFCDLILRRNIKFRWGSQANVKKDMDSILFKKMKKAGCSWVNIGIESGSDRVLKLMNKKQTVDEAKQMLKLCHQSGIETIINIIVGFPGEEEEDYWQTEEFVKENKENIDKIGLIQQCVVLKGSNLMIHANKYNIKSIDYTNKEWISMDMRNTHNVRLQRQKRLLCLLSSLGYDYADKVLNEIKDEKE